MKPSLAAIALIVFGMQLAFAQNSGQPGLWETRSVTQGDLEWDAVRKQDIKEFAALSPAQKQDVRERVAKKGAVLGADGAVAAVLICRSPKDFEPVVVASGAKETPGCRYEIKPPAQSVVAYRFACKDGRKGEGTIKYTSPTQIDNAETYSRPAQNGFKAFTATSQSRSKFINKRCEVPRKAP
jgi:hypothetical protein